jgi:hypothetical protein
MKTESEFQKIGKKMPYSVPDGFFDRITEKTLEEARSRKKISRKTIVLWRTMAVAASIAILFTVGYLLFTPSPEKHTEQASLEEPSINQPDVPEPEPEIIPDPQPEKEIISQSITVRETNNLSDQSKETNEVDIYETDINEVLSALTNDELLQLATMYNTDIFLEETENNMQ